MATAAALDQDYTCSYCYEHLADMTDPRELPCGHVFCLVCLRSDFGAGGTDTKCPCCSAVHKKLDLDACPEWEKDDAVRPKESSFPPQPCSKDKCSSDAMSYCHDCDAKLCGNHKKMHDEWLGDGHSYIPFDEYRRLPEKYERPLCKTHGLRQTLACEVCDMLACEECDLTSGCGQHANTQHKLKSLTKLQKKLEEEYNVLIKGVSDKHTEFTEKNKDTQFRFGDLVEAYNEEEKLKEVDRVVERQFAEIKRAADIEKQRIREFPAKMDVEVTAFTEGLLVKEDHLGGLAQRLTQMLRESHIAEVIKQNKANQKAISEATGFSTGNCQILQEMVVAPTGFLWDVEVKLRPLLPKQFVKFYTGSQQVRLLIVTDRGDLLYYVQSGGIINITDTHCKQVKAKLSLQNVQSFAQSKDRVFVVAFNGNNLICDSYNYTFEDKKDICTFPANNSHSANQIAVTDDHIVIVENSSYFYQLRVYEHNGTHLHNISQPRNITGIWSLPGGNIFVRNNANEVQKLNIASKAATKQWTNGAAFISTDEAGLIYECQYQYQQTQKLNIRLPDSGKSVRELSTAEYNNITQLSIGKNMLAILDANSRIQLYHIEY